MKCEDFGRYLDNYESLSDQEKTEMNDHAAMCEQCQQELDFFLSMLSTVKTLPKIEPPADFMASLNDRLDAEDKKAAPQRIVYHVRRNWKQYVTLAACFALVAVITANRGILFDRIEGNEDGVITEETVSDGDNTAPNGTTEETVVPAEQENIPQAETNVTAETAAAEPVPQTIAVAAVQRTPRTPASSSRPASSSSSNNSAPGTTVTVQTETPATETASAAEQPVIRSEGDDYGIALRGTISSIAPSETAYMPYDLTVEEVSASLRANEIISKYSMSDGGERIALGRYYSIDKNGKPIMTDEINTPVAIGSLKISSSDAEKAMDVLSQYPHDESGDLYTTDTENFSKILSDLSDEGVTYTDHTLSGSEDVKFTIEFN